MEKSLRETEKRFRTFFEELGDAVFVFRTDEENFGEILEVNPTAESQTGYSEEELIGKNIIDDLVVEMPEGFSVRDISGGSFSGESLTFTDKKRRKDGSEYWTEVTVTPIEYEGEEAALSINRDITERKRMKEREEFLHSLLRHDLGNKVQIVRNSLELLKDSDLNEEQKEYIKMAMDASESGFDLIDKVRTLREVSEVEVNVVDIDSILSDVLEDYEKKVADEGIDLEVNKEGCEVYGGTLLEELFSNLVENAILHSGCGKIIVSSSLQDDECLIRVEDDGCGIADQDKEMVFQRDFKKGESSGSGLGMHLAKRIVEEYGGRIEAGDSELGGARIDVYLEKAK